MKTLPIIAAAVVAAAASAQIPVRPWSLTNQPLAERVAADFKEIPHAADFVHYDVPPMSTLQRLPDVYPRDGTAGGTVRIVAAGDEYEPGSFLIYPLRNLGKTQLSLTPFKTSDGKVFPADDLDLKVVKVWYQNRNAWYSYYGDVGLKLVPELLLNDEDLIRVDTEKEANYARIIMEDGSVQEQWINPPRSMNRVFWDNRRGGGAFKPMAPGFDDAKTLQPVALEKGVMRNFFLTAHVRAGTPAGLYRGAVKVGGHGEIPVTIRVLDFDLPKPKCYFDDDRDFYVCSYSYNAFTMIMEENGGDLELAKRQFKATMEDMVAHNQDMNMLRWGLNAETKTCWRLMMEAGMRPDVGVGGVDVSGSVAKAKRMAAVCDRIFGHHNFYLALGDEPSPEWLMDKRKSYRTNQEAGFKFILAGKDQVYRKIGYLLDWHNLAKDPEDASSTTLWNQFGSNPHVAWYATMHVGVENPEYNRRQNGMAAYLTGYSAHCNYAHHYGPYNDDTVVYRPMVFAYGCYSGVIDTIQWEGFREGIDDIRYATALVKLARPAAKSQDVNLRYTANKALQYLATFRREADDLDACRAEMTNYILALRGLGKGERGMGKGEGGRGNQEPRTRNQEPGTKRP